MKLLLAVAITFVSCTLLGVAADNIIENSDFSAGLDHWYGGGRTPADFANFLTSERGKWGPLIQKANLQLE